MSTGEAPPSPATFPVVVDKRFVLDNESVFRRVTKSKGLLKAETSIKDDQEQLLFTVHGYGKKRQYLHDAVDQPLLCVEKEGVGLRASLMGRDRWKAYSGDGSEQNHVFFHCKRLKSKLFHVFLPTNTSNETMPDFIVRGTNGLKFTVHYSDHLVAETKKQGEWKLSFKGRKIYTTAFPGVDQAFIAAILLLMEGEIPKNTEGNVTVAVPDGGGGAAACS